MVLAIQRDVVGLNGTVGGSHLQDTQRAPELFGKSLVVFMNYAESEVAKHSNYINALDAEQLPNYVQE